MTEQDGRIRTVIEGVVPEVDGGRFPIKRTLGERVVVEADIFTDGHEALSAVLLHRKEEVAEWSEAAMEPLPNDRWRGEFEVRQLGQYRYTLLAWLDRFKAWRRDLTKKIEAGQDVSIDLQSGAQFLIAASQRACGPDVKALEEWASFLRSDESQTSRVALAVSEQVQVVMSRYPDRRFATRYPQELAVVVDRAKAAVSTWYEMFPRSSATEPGRHGSFKDCEARLSYISAMGFDVLYLPPIHPIGKSHRKGKNNAPLSAGGDPGSPWAIGSDAGGHKAVHPELGTLDDFRWFLHRAREHGLEIALDLAFQCSPDHPYVQAHPEWFRWRPDGTVQYAENPPKKYEDIYPLEFETDHWQKLWEELRSVVLFWAEEGVRIFRVDNPHTKPFRFWEWLIAEIKKVHPDVLFLAEAFTRPKVMYQLAKLGFSQSYTYFAWRNTKWELTEYFTHLMQSPVREYFRPSLWPNTPDILTEYLQHGGRPAFMTRLLLAATLGASYGIYGPAFDLCERRAREPGSEEYLNSEKYEIKQWELTKPESLRELISLVNRIRIENPSLQHDWNLRFHAIENDQLICYSKHTEDLANIILVVVNLDPHHVHSGWVQVPLEEFGLPAYDPYQVHDLLSGARFLWRGPRNYVELNPAVVPGHIFRVRRRVRTEQDFEYYL